MTRRSVLLSGVILKGCCSGSTGFSRKGRKGSYGPPPFFPPLFLLRVGIHADRTQEQQGGDEDGGEQPPADIVLEHDGAEEQGSGVEGWCEVPEAEVEGDQEAGGEQRHEHEEDDPVTCVGGGLPCGQVKDDQRQHRQGGDHHQAQKLLQACEMTASRLAAMSVEVAFMGSSLGFA